MAYEYTNHAKTAGNASRKPRGNERGAAMSHAVHTNEFTTPAVNKIWSRKYNRLTLAFITRSTRPRGERRADVVSGEVRRLFRGEAKRDRMTGGDIDRRSTPFASNEKRRIDLANCQAMSSLLAQSLIRIPYDCREPRLQQRATIPPAVETFSNKKILVYYILSTLQKDLMDLSD